MKCWTPLILVLVLATGGCGGHPPPNITPQATAAFYATRVVHGLDLIRDLASDAHNQTPPKLSAHAALAVVDYHASAVKILRDSPNGYKAALLTGLDELSAKLSPDDRKVIDAGIALVKTVLGEVP